jgi:hypothetical protein
MTKRQTQMNNTCTKVNNPAENSPEQDRQTNGQTPTLLQDTLLVRRNYKASRLTPLARLITLSYRRSNTLWQETQATYLSVTGGPW